MQRCPSCNARLRERTICSRCKSDLTVLINSEQAAEYWLVKAIHDCLADKIEQSIVAISISIALKITKLAVSFREFLIQRQCRDILELIAQRKLLNARTLLYRVRMLLPYSHQLRHLYSFSDYLLAQQFENSS